MMVSILLTIVLQRSGCCVRILQQPTVFAIRWASMRACAITSRYALPTSHGPPSLSHALSLSPSLALTLSFRNACMHSCTRNNPSQPGLHGHHDHTSTQPAALQALVPNTNDTFLLIPFGLLWSEVRANDLLTVKAGPTGECLVLRGEGTPETTAFWIHSRLHLARPQAASVVFHTHMPWATSLCCLEDSRWVNVHVPARVPMGRCVEKWMYTCMDPDEAVECCMRINAGVSIHDCVMSLFAQASLSARMSNQCISPMHACQL